MNKTFVLNLKRRIDRKENVEKIFKNKNFSDYNFYESIDGQTFNSNSIFKTSNYIYKLK